MRIESALKLASSLTTNYLKGGSKPFLVFLYLSFRCNLRCDYCGLPNLRMAEIDTEAWLEIIDQLAELGCRRINFIGGEPLMHPGLPRMLARAGKHGISRAVSTNGLLVADKLETLSGSDTLVLSLDGVGASANRARGSHVWRSALEAITMARSIGLPLKINTVVSRNNLARIRETIFFATREMGCGLTISPVRHGIPILCNNAEEIGLASKEFRSLLLFLSQESKRNRRILISPSTYTIASRWPQHEHDYLEQHEQTKGRGGFSSVSCQAGRSYFSILPNGQAAPCALRFDLKSVSNAVTDGVEAAWRGLHNHRCSVCSAPCLIELNSLFNYRPLVLMNFAFKHLACFH